ncbi:S66 family peptidase [Mycoplasma struthionis]|uniref:LD-carboxypeptidase n=1 Tax=Mycoplasma struthionis TaxID=538220 RepID=A0A502M7Q3_9MOLU|nr:S66 peptidase family protein [Mycoplasma struthionis]TPI02284.1 LD-carboxypeptidase [Mycoplasma struthionis]
MKKLKNKDTVAIISLSSGLLGESFCLEQKLLAEKRLKELNLNFVYTPNALKGIDYLEKNPQKRAEDLIWAFENKNIKAIICALGGFDTYKTLEFILNNKKNIKTLQKNKKIFVGYSDTTVNHLMLNKLKIKSFYGIALLTCIAEWDKEILDYTKSSINWLFNINKPKEYIISEYWYKERKTFGFENKNIPREKYKEEHGYELLQGKAKFSGILLGGCLESIFSLLEKQNNNEIDKKYWILDNKTFKNKVLLLETSEEKLEPEIIKNQLEYLKKYNIFSNVKAVIIGKPQDEKYYLEYKNLFKTFFSDPYFKNIPVLYNINIGHAYPKMILKLNSKIKVDFLKSKIKSY